MLHVAGLFLLAATAAGQTAPSGCSAAVNRQFDFWVGEWSVTDRTTGRPAGQSNVEKLYAGCTLRENWASGGFRGGSLNSYSALDGHWHQMWMDSAGAVRHFIGGLEADGRMVLTARQKAPSAVDQTRLIRMAFTANPDGSVRQYSDLSDDGGKTWQLRYDFEYRRIGP